MCSQTQMRNCSFKIEILVTSCDHSRNLISWRLQQSDSIACCLDDVKILQNTSWAWKRTFVTTPTCRYSVLNCFRTQLQSPLLFLTKKSDQRFYVRGKLYEDTWARYLLNKYCHIYYISPQQNSSCSRVDLRAPAQLGRENHIWHIFTVCAHSMTG
jgi:hypothetical protein